MPVRIEDAELRAFKPGDDDPFAVVGTDALGPINITETAQDAQDTATTYRHADVCLLCPSNVKLLAGSIRKTIPTA